MAENGKARPDDSDEAAEAPKRPSLAPEGRERRTYDRIPVRWPVDFGAGENFLYSYIANISAMGIFIYSRTPPPVGTHLSLRFAPPGEEPLELEGEVTWVNPWHDDGDNINPGMGVRFVELDLDTRERLVQLVQTIAYLPDAPES